MMKMVCRPLALTVIALALMSTTMQATAAEPRAWLLTKGKAQAVLVAESHVGTPIENDSYYDTVVRPSYAAADVAIMETYFGPEQLRNEGLERGTPCPGDPNDRRTDRLAAAFDALAAATRDNRLEVPNWATHWNILPEYLLISALLDSFIIQTLGPAYDTAIETQGGPGISLRLRAQEQGPRTILGFDTVKELRNHFCTANAAQRQDYVADRVLAASRLLRLKLADPSYKELGRLAAPTGRVVAGYVRCVDRATACPVDQVSDDVRLLQENGWMWAYSPGTFEISLKRRTHAWVPLITKTMSEQRRGFVIVGAMHLPDLNIGGKVEPGLISLLRKQGISATLIAGPADIAADFLAPSWVDRFRSRLIRL